MRIINIIILLLRRKNEILETLLHDSSLERVCYRYSDDENVDNWPFCSIYLFDDLETALE